MDKNINVNGDLYGVGFAQEGAIVNQTINLPEHKTLMQLTSKLGKDTIIGRAKELEEIDTLLKESSSLLLINGIGGIGKSTIASYYLHSQKESLDYYGFFEGLGSFTSELREPLALQEEKENDAFMEALSKLRNLKGNKLLVFDDIKEIEKNQDKIDKILALKNSGYKILLTSREEIEDIEQYYLDLLSLDDAKELFNSIYKVEDEVLLEEILGYLDCHAFFVEMTAKTLKSKKTLTPEIIKDKFDNGEFSTIKRKRKESFNDYLNELFSFDKLDAEEILMLKQLSILPSIEIKFEFLQEIFDKKDDEEFEEVLNYLCEKGWLTFFENGYKLHQIVKEFILVNHTPSLQDFKIGVDYFNNLIKNSTNPKIAIIAQEYFIYINSIIKVVKRLRIENLEIAKLFMSLGNIYSVLGDYEESIIFMQLSQHLYSDILGKDDIMTSTLNHNLGKTYYEMGEYDNALPLILKDLELAKNTYEEGDLDFASSYSNIGNIYLQQGETLDALKLFHLALEISLEKLGENSLETATYYNNLGNAYSRGMRINESLFFFKKSLDIMLRVEDENYPDVLGVYNNLGELYCKQEEYTQSLSYLTKALELHIKLFNDNTHPTLGIIYGNIALVYKGMKKYEKSYADTQRCINIFEQNFSPNHPYLIGAKSELLKIQKML